MSRVEIRDDGEQLDSPAGRRDIGPLEALWSLFSSMKTAIVLLLCLALASTFGTVIEDKWGISVYQTAWFSMLLALVGLNLAVCSINRFGIAWNRTFKPNVEVSAERVATMARSETVRKPGSVEYVADNLVAALRSRSYRPIKQSAEGRVSIYAAKGMASVWGPYLTHLSILVIFAGAIFGSILGSEGNAIIMEGERVSSYTPKGSQKEKPLGFEVGLRSFKIEHDSKGNPTGYRSDLQVYDGGKPTVRKVIDVNHPLSYKGLSFYQTDYGLAGLTMKITAPDGSVARIPFDIGNDERQKAKVYVIAGQPFKQFTLNGKKWTLFVHNLVPDYVGGERLNGSMLPLNVAVNVMLNDRFPEYRGLDAWKKMGWIPVSKSAKSQGLTVTLEQVVSYTGLQVSRNPGLPVVYAGFALMVLGVFMSFYVTRKLIRVVISPSEDGSDIVIGAASRADASVFDRDMQRLHDALSS